MKRASVLFVLGLVACQASATPRAAPPVVEAAPLAPASVVSARAVAKPPPPPPTFPPTFPAIAGDLPKTLAFPSLALSVDAIGGSCKEEILPHELVDRFPDDAPVAIWEQRLTQGGCIAFPSDENIDVSLVLVAGAASFEGAIHGAASRPWSTAVAPGGGVTARATGKGSARLIVIVSTTTGGPIACAGGRACRTGTPTPSKPWSTTRATHTWLVDLSEQKDLAWAGDAFHARIGRPASETTPVSHVVDSLLFSPTAAVAEHVHDKQWECIVTLEGEGELTQRLDGDAAIKTPARPGSVACIPAGRRHAFKNGETRYVGLQVYAPPGPEQRFVKLSAAESQAR